MRGIVINIEPSSAVFGGEGNLKPFKMHRIIKIRGCANTIIGVYHEILDGCGVHHRNVDDSRVQCR